MGAVLGGRPSSTVTRIFFMVPAPPRAFFSKTSCCVLPPFSATAMVLANSTRSCGRYLRRSARNSVLRRNSRIVSPVSLGGGRGFTWSTMKLSLSLLSDTPARSVRRSMRLRHTYTKGFVLRCSLSGCGTIFTRYTAWSVSTSVRRCARATFATSRFTL